MRCDGRAFFFAALDGISQSVQAQAALHFRALVAIEALGFEDGLDVLEEIHRALLRLGELRGHGLDLRRDEAVNLVVRREALAQSWHLHFGRRSQPLLGGFAALGPVAIGARPHCGTTFGVHLGQTCGALIVIGGPSGIGVGHLPCSRRQQLPGLAALLGDGQHHLARFWAVL